MKAILLASALIAATACGDSARALSGGTSSLFDATAQQRCEAERPNVTGYGRVDRLTAAFSLTAGDLARWMLTRHGPLGPQGTSRWADYPATELLALCYFDGVFSGFPRPAAAAGRPPYDRIAIVAVGSSGHVLDAAGYRADLPATRPLIP